jgi:hypothetical protein
MQQLAELKKKALETALDKPVKNLVSFGKDAKTIKGEKYGVRTGIVYLAPANISGFEMCPSRTRGCTAACLFTAGQGRYANVKQGRLRRTYTFIHRSEEFLTRLLVEIDKEKTKVGDSMLLAIRLNGTSDIAYEDYPVTDVDGTVYPNIFAARRDIQFYDYTKRFDRLGKIKDIPNYNVTFSRAETLANRTNATIALSMGFNVTVVFRGDLPETYDGYPVVDGDETDIRFWDSGCPTVIGLKAKGKAIHDESGFVVD